MRLNSLTDGLHLFGWMISTAEKRKRAERNCRISRQLVVVLDDGSSNEKMGTSSIGMALRVRHFTVILH
jgi:hypothetical protein